MGAKGKQIKQRKSAKATPRKRSDKIPVGTMKVGRMIPPTSWERSPRPGTTAGRTTAARRQEQKTERSDKTRGRNSNRGSHPKGQEGTRPQHPRHGVGAQQRRLGRNGRDLQGIIKIVLRIITGRWPESIFFVNAEQKSSHL